MGWGAGWGNGWLGLDVPGQKCDFWKVLKLARNPVKKLRLDESFRIVQSACHLVAYIKSYGQITEIIWHYDFHRKMKWKNVKVGEFQIKTDELMRSADLSNDVQTRSQQIEKILLEAAASSAENQELPNLQSSENETLRELLEQRRALKIGTAEKTQISKHIQNLEGDWTIAKH